MQMHRYTAYGLHIASEFPLPELRADTQDGSTDLNIGYGVVPASLPDVTASGIAWQSNATQLLFNVHEVARYLVLGDREIRIEPISGATEASVRLFLLGSVLGALLHARRIVVMHASVIQTSRGAVLFMGRSGSGKSTLLGAFLQRGYRMLTDDKAGIVIDASTGAPFALPGMPFLRLTEDAVSKLGFAVNDLLPNANLHKYVVPVRRFCDGPIPVAAAYAVHPHNRPEIQLERVQAVDRFETLATQIYRSRFVRHSDQREAVFKTLGAVAAHSGVAKVRWPDHPCKISELADAIEKDFS